MQKSTKIDPESVLEAAWGTPGTPRDRPEGPQERPGMPGRAPGGARERFGQHRPGRTALEQATTTRLAKKYRLAYRYGID